MFFFEKNVNIIFNNFLNTYLRTFYASFPITKSQNSYKSKPWLINGIRISCANKTKLYLTYRNNDSSQKEYYKKYCQILTTVIMSGREREREREKKTLYYIKLLLKSNNKPKTTWNIVKTITNNKNAINNISTININDKFSSNSLAMQMLSTAIFHL